MTRVQVNRLLFYGALLIGCVAVAGCISNLDKPSTSYVSTSGSWYCRGIPSTFQEADLVGIWQADFGGGGSQLDILTLRSDGSYQQVFTDSAENYRYEGTWNKWWLEHRTSGGIYIHLDGMRYCAFKDSCMDPGDEEAGGSIGFYDFCERQWMQLKNEFVLALVGSDPRVDLHGAPRGIALVHLKPPGWEGPFFRYTLLGGLGQ